MIEEKVYHAQLGCFRSYKYLVKEFSHNINILSNKMIGQYKTLFTCVSEAKALCNKVFISCITKYNPEKKATFKTYFNRYTKYALLDHYKYMKKKSDTNTVQSDSFYLCDSQLSREQTAWTTLCATELNNQIRSSIDKDLHCIYDLLIKGFKRDEIATMEDLTVRQVDYKIKQIRTSAMKFSQLTI